ncbi:alpha,alpha-phosphotrehalase [Bacillus sp. AFS088145]|uniref:alpha,alpha-phosphotrehalase n=1 Tax=Bacillus sp. AFS088145 TaxID=2033514 RepID=UPI000BFAAA70|nr:alpha,alpha-phosphotrehalase [Bacillus sp. AFS088145]PFH92022.1 alpha,alpha-phosphotrehalase [Bacillus sp. AFS088145]
MKDFKNSVVYQIYPKSFYDSNGDGFGDLRGVTKKLDYLKELGVDYIWLTPFYVSPQNDNGYDVADYRKIDPAYGTMEDFDELVKAAKRCDIEIMLDMVFNHTSSENEWFKKALDGDKKYKNYYIFREEKDGKEPTNWLSKFGGSTWEKVENSNEYYLHLFDKTQPDLNWENDEVQNEIFDIVNFWIDKGVKGFRLDVINLISKPKVMVDDETGDGRKYYTDGPRIHEYLKKLNNETFGKNEEIITVGEMSSTSIDHCIRYSNPSENELSMVFSFHHLKIDYKDGQKWSLMDFDFMSLKSILDQWQKGMQSGNGWNALFWCNHDQPRIVSRIGNDQKYHKESAKMLATSMHLLRGTPYIYQGEEIGMPNPKFDIIEEYRDVESLNYYKILKENGVPESEILAILKSKSRDNSRTPMQWNDSINAGFTTGTPWISTGKDYEQINVEKSLVDEDSVFHHYKKLINLRKEFDIISTGTYDSLLLNHEQIFAYTRKLGNQMLLVVNNFYGEDTHFKLPENIAIGEYNKQILISNYNDSSQDLTEFTLRPYESICYLLEKNVRI